MGRVKELVSLVPWWLPDSDLREANSGEPELRRNTMRNGKAEQHLGLNVFGQAATAPALGMIAIRCRRVGATLIPLTLSLPDVPIVVTPRRTVTVKVKRRGLRYELDTEGDGA